ncbi:MAG: hypothetical protein L0241_16160 [Planctomycetia bacterium]|nr:hypothetical protein [Planctomycetia bacterium]
MLFNVDFSTVSGNTFSGSLPGSATTGSAVAVGGGSNNLTVTGNTFTNFGNRALSVSDLGLGFGSNSNFTFSNNTITSNINLLASGRAIIDLEGVGGTSQIVGNSLTLTGTTDTTVAFADAIEIGGLGTGTVNVLNNTFTGGNVDASGSGIDSAGVRLLSTLSATAVINVQNNTISGFVNGVAAETLLAGTDVNVNFNNLASNSALAILNGTGADIDASFNWFGTAVAADVAAEVSGDVDFTPWLDVGTDISTAAGFQPDLSVLHVDDAGLQVGTEGRIQEALNLAASSTVIVESGTFTGDVIVNPGDTLAGIGTISGVVTVTPGGKITAGTSATGTAGILETGNLDLSTGAQVVVDVNGSTAGTGHDQLDVTGTVDLSGTTLIVNATTGVANGTTVTIINNDSTDSVIGTFAGLAQGATVTATNGQQFQISYTGGSDGNDVTLTAITAPPAPVVDLSVTKTDNTTVVAAGQAITYTVVASNPGTVTVTGATLVDNFPTTLTGVTWTSSASGGASGNSASGSGNISQTLTLLPGSSVTYTINATVSSSATLGSAITNTATISTPSGTTDSVPSNNSATDMNTVVQMVDLSVTKTDGQTNVAPGQTITYTIAVSNAGATAVNGAILIDNFPATLTGVTWTSSASGGATGNTASGSGNINETLNLPVGSLVTYTVTATVDPNAANGTTISNTATITTPSGTTDNAPSNNTATDTNTVAGFVDLSVTKTNNVSVVTRGTTTTYTIVVTNAGNITATGAQFVDPVSAELTNVVWTSSSGGGATGSAGSGSGSINETLNLPVGASVTYTLSGTVTADATGTLDNTATITAAAGTTDSNPANNATTDSDMIFPAGPVVRLFAVGAGPGANAHVKVFNDDGSLRFSFFSFVNFNGGVTVATGDVNRDGVEDIVVGAGMGGTNGHVKVFDGVTGSEIASFFSFMGYLGSVDVALGDVNNDGAGDIIVGTSTASSHVKAFDFASGSTLMSFFTYVNFEGGVNVAAGDYDGIGGDEIITGVASAGPSHLKVFNFAQAELASFMAFPGSPVPIDVAAGDILGDDRAEIVAVPMGAGGNQEARIFAGGTGVLVNSFLAPFTGDDTGLRVALGDVDNDVDDDIILSTGAGHNANVQAFDAQSLAQVLNITAFDNFNGGVFVG